MLEGGIVAFRRWNQGSRDETARSSWPSPPADPRPDLVKDSEGWKLLLSIAFLLDENPSGPYGTLSGLRCCGAQLVVINGKTTLIADAIDLGEIPNRGLGSYEGILDDLLHALDRERHAEQIALAPEVEAEPAVVAVT